MNSSTELLKEFLDAYEAARKAFERAGNVHINYTLWSEAQSAVEDTGFDLDHAAVAYLLVTAMSRSHIDSSPRPWLLDAIPHLLVQLKLEESND